MFQRIIIKELHEWASSKGRKPLVFRGARQVGKTTTVIDFGNTFPQFIHLNLEIAEHKRLFVEIENVDELIKAIFYLNGSEMERMEETLLFIDEIQAEPKAFPMLRYFYEQHPKLRVIAAGSLLESLFDINMQFPVGRVEYKLMKPVTFYEFLGAIGEEASQKMIDTVPFPSYAHSKLTGLFQTYAIIGGMPEVVADYAEFRDLTRVSKLYASLLQGYLNDVEKYARNDAMRQVIRHVIRASFTEAGNRIKFQGFGRSNYRSREIGEAFRTLEKAMILHLVYPITNTELPIATDFRRSPKLQVLDIGLFNFFSGIQKELVLLKDLYPVHKGRLMEQLINQGVLALNTDPLTELHFWVREKARSSAEVDLIQQHGTKVIPVEVKAGHSGKLRSLHQFMDLAPHDLAVRIHGGKFNIEKVKTTSGKKFHLMNLPHYLTAKLPEYIVFFDKEVA